LQRSFESRGLQEVIGQSVILMRMEAGNGQVA
jgi:hypothetical protein